MNAISLILSKGLLVGKKLVSSKWFWIALASLILILLLRKYWKVLSGKIFTTIKGDYTVVTDIRKAYLDDLIEDVASIISKESSKFFDFNWTSAQREDKLWVVYGLNDSDFLYFVKEYNKRFQNGFKNDLDRAFLPFTNADEKLISRVKNTGIV